MARYCKSQERAYNSRTLMRMWIMKKFIAITILSLMSVVSISANACPKGEHPHGGTGSHHKGGWCSP